jgi:hypothetical protein
MSGRISDVVSWLITTINADATLNTLGLTDGNIFFHNAPENTPFPYIILQVQSNSKSYVLGHGQAFTRTWMAVKCLDMGTDGGNRARRIRDRVEDVLNLQTPTLPEGYALDIRTTTGFEYSEAESGNMNFYHVGSVFVINLG